mmetsp:Transcript_64276/g.119453  ORF Transcript_64276/g.119453 Transcript_64276/m.119453 type:complete len:428 (+) Transcript_64276:83-1366(+)
MSQAPSKKEKVRKLFEKYDANGDGTLSLDELEKILKAIGVEGSKCNEYFTHIDQNKNGVIEYQEFLDWLYEESGDYAAGKSIVEVSVSQVFYSYCTGQRELDGKSFAKLCKDGGLVDKQLTTTDIDLIFTKVVAKGQRKIILQQFEKALVLIAERRSTSIAEVSAAVASIKGPVLQGTHAEAVRFHDDKSTYTGVHQHGGPESVPKGQGSLPAVSAKDQEALQPVAPSAPPTGRPKKAAAPQQASTKLPDVKMTTPRGETPREAAAPPPAAAENKGLLARPPELYRPESWVSTFAAYCGSQPDMDGKTWAKLLKDSWLLDKKFSSGDADLIFAKCVTKGHRRMNEAQFEAALAQVAERKHQPLQEVKDSITIVGGPILRGTEAEAVRFHDDKKTYTGVHAHGGLESIPLGQGTATQLASKGMATSKG